MKNSHRMQCLEVWGGYEAIDTALEMTGLDVWAYSTVFENDDQGGDVLYLSSCASGRITRILVADVSGHGEKVKSIAKNLRDLMRDNINRIEQTQLMGAVNESFSQLEEIGAFATAILATYFYPKKTLSVSSAGHPSPLIYDSGIKEWRILDEASAESSENESLQPALPLGITDSSSYEAVQIKLKPQDMVFCYTDAFMEGVDEQENLIGTKGLMHLLNELRGTENNEILKELISKIKSLHPQNLKNDDCTAVLMRPNKKGVTFFDNVAAPFRFINHHFKSKKL